MLPGRNAIHKAKEEQRQGSYDAAATKVVLHEGFIREVKRDKDGKLTGEFKVCTRKDQSKFYFGGNWMKLLGGGYAFRSIYGSVTDVALIGATCLIWTDITWKRPMIQIVALATEIDETGKGKNGIEARVAAAANLSQKSSAPPTGHAGV